MPETRPFEMQNVPSLLDAAKARARGSRRSDDAFFLRRLIALEDWLEYEHPRNRYRAPLRQVRRTLETRLDP